MSRRNFKRGAALTIALLLVAGVPATAPFAFNSEIDLSALFARLWAPAAPTIPAVDREALNRWAAEMVAGREFALESSPLLQSDHLVDFAFCSQAMPVGYVTAPVFGHARAMVEAVRFQDLPQPPPRIRLMSLPALARVSASGGNGVSAGDGSQGADNAGGPSAVGPAAETPNTEVAADMEGDVMTEIDVADASSMPQHLPTPGALSLLALGVIGLLNRRARRRA